MGRLDLGVLDISVIRPGSTAGETLLETTDLICHVESMGYSRYWLSEHHGREVAHSAPELLVPILAGMTSKIRVGTAGILLKAYNPLKVAKNFRLLEALFPRRIDLGIGAGLPSPGHAVLHDLIEGTLNYEDKLQRVIEYLRDLEDVHLVPRTLPPEIWILGSGGMRSAAFAAESGTCFSHALFLPGSRDVTDTMRHYQDHFRGSAELAAPRANVAVAGVCAESETKAAAVRASFMHPGWIPTVVGTPRQCREQLCELQERYRVDEIIFLSLGGTVEDRMESYALLAAEAGLAATSNDRTTPKQEEAVSR